jgi:hypothetical protein
MGPVLKGCLVQPVLPVVVKAPQEVVEVVEAVAVQQDHLAGLLQQIPVRLCLFRLFPLSGTPLTSGIDKPWLLVLPNYLIPQPGPRYSFFRAISASKKQNFLANWLKKMFSS